MKHKHPYIAIEVENRKLTPFLELPAEQKVRSMPLTTMVDNQKRAIVKLLLKLPDKQVLLKEFDLKHLKPGPAGPPRFLLDCRWDGKKVLTVSLKVDGSLYSEEKIRIATYMKKKRGFVVALILLLATFTGAALFLVLPGISRTRTDRPAQTPAIRRTAPTEKSTAEQPTVSKAPAQESSGPARQAAPKTTDPEPASSDPPKQPASQTPAVAPAASGTAEKPGRQTAAEGATDSPSSTAAAAAEVEAQAPELVPVSRNIVLYFDPNNTELTQEARRSLEDLSREISEWESLSFTFEGHCALFGTEEGRIELSRDRAQKSAAYVSRLTGIDASQFAISWFAGEKPVSRAQDQQDLNRRVEISVRGEAEAP
jgi:outer membrane protein OmpA-like peptidoglycan-associated protein